MELNAENIKTSHLGHLGIVAGIIKKLGLIDKIDKKLVKSSNNKKISHGQGIAAMILNGLGFTERRLYMVSHFFQHKPIDKYLGDGVLAEDLNDDALGRALDVIYAYGTTKFYSEVAFAAAQEAGLLGKSAHLDTSTISVTGEYDENETEVKIIHGYSKDHRHDLKQLTLSLTTTGKSCFPIWMEVLSGNSSDKTSFHKTIDSVINFQKNLDLKTSFYWVADSALYSKKKLLAHGDSVLWLTRAPESIKDVKKLLEMTSLRWDEIDDKYKTSEIGSSYGDIRQRWIIVESSAARKKEQLNFYKKIEKEEKEINKIIKSAGKERFYSEKEVQKFIKKISVKYKNFIFDESISSYGVKDSKYFKVSISSRKNEIHMKQELERKGRFILATNDVKGKITPAKLLAEYKNQSKTEKGFSPLKDDSFLISDIYLKKPERVQALLVVICLCLMVYNVGEYLLRNTLKEKSETIKNVINKDVFKPTLKMVFILMRPIDLVLINIGSEKKFIVSNFSDNHKKILNLLGNEFISMYDF